MMAGARSGKLEAPNCGEGTVGPLFKYNHDFIRETTLINSWSRCNKEYRKSAHAASAGKGRRNFTA